jgi:hypothetical protein
LTIGDLFVEASILFANASNFVGRSWSCGLGSDQSVARPYSPFTYAQEIGAEQATGRDGRMQQSAIVDAGEQRQQLETDGGE